MRYSLSCPRDESGAITRRISAEVSPLLLAAGGGNLGSEVGLFLLDAFTARVAHEAGNLDRAADLALGFLQRLRDRLAAVVDEGLLEQADFLVVCLQARLDDLL